jgi:hypothetical protein
MTGWKRILIIALMILVVVAFALVVAPSGTHNTTTTTAPTLQTTGQSVNLNTTNYSTSFSGNSTAPAPDISQLKVLSVRLVNTSIGSDLEFNVTFTNSGPSQIYYVTSPVRVTSIPCSGATATEFIGGNTTTTVVNSTSITPGCPNALPVAVDQGPSGHPSGCSDVVSLIPLSPGATVSASDSPCADGVAFKIVGSGVFEATLSVTWAPTGSDSYLQNPYTTSITQLFKVG